MGGSILSTLQLDEGGWEPEGVYWWYIESTLLFDRWVGESKSIHKNIATTQVGGREGPTLVPGRHYHCSIQVG